MIRGEGSPWIGGVWEVWEVWEVCGCAVIFALSKWAEVGGVELSGICEMAGLLA